MAAGPPANGANRQNSAEEVEQQIEGMFEKADDLMINQEKFQEARQLYLEILELDPENIDGLNSVATCIKHLTTTEQSHFDECLPYYQKALEADPEDFETNFNIGILFYDQKQDAERAIHYLKIAVNEEKNASALFNLAVIYEDKGDRVRAKEYYQEVLKVDPQHYQTKVNLAIILEKEGKSHEAQV